MVENHRVSGTPGVHSHNSARAALEAAAPAASLNRLRRLLLFVGVCAISYYAYNVSDEYVYQRYQNWAFDQQITGRPAVTFTDYLKAKTPFALPFESSAVFTPATKLPGAAAPPNGALLGRVSIERLNVSAMVRQGVDSRTLSVAVGHVPSTALPGQLGNFAIAAHRDTLFRALKDIRKNDVVTFQSTSGTYTYQILGTEIVKPSDVRVLQPDGGGFIVKPGPGPQRLLTMITCFPFYYVGSAPQRFVVEGKLLSSAGGS